MFGFYRMAAAVPEIRVADIDFNKKQITGLISKADKNSAALVVFPELCITGYTCADLFHQSALMDKTCSAIKEIAEFSKNLDLISIVGAPIHYKNSLYNCGVVIQKGEIKGIVPKSYNPNYREFYEKRWFSAGKNIRHEWTRVDEKPVPFGTNFIFEYNKYFRFGIEICEDLWNVIPPSSNHAVAGAIITANLSASNELIAKADYRRDLIKQQSARCISAYIYASSGVWESTTDLVFGGHSLIAENGVILKENERFQRKSNVIFSDIDCQRLLSTRISESSFGDNGPLDYAVIKLDSVNKIKDVDRLIDPHPFVPASPDRLDTRCREIFSIQSAGLAKRLEHTGSRKAVVGISGGLDSTLALLVCIEAFKLLKKKNPDIIAVTMPGFGTSKRTFNNAVKLCRLLNADLRKIKITNACMRHFKDINHDPEIHDSTYENVQARERTQLLMDIANQEKGIVVGSSDLSELALGWTTYNGDHMSMYAVNCGVPKTLIRCLIDWAAEHSGPKLKSTLHDIINTPVTPELLPSRKDDEIYHKTEEIIGPYELHDFFLYHTIKYGATPNKIKYLAKLAFKRKYSESEISKYLKIFLNRFFSQQFKRSCIPDGPKVGTICLSPRGDWRMPSDAKPSAWLNP